MLAETAHCYKQSCGAGAEAGADTGEPMGWGRFVRNRSLHPAFGALHSEPESGPEPEPLKKVAPAPKEVQFCNISKLENRTDVSCHVMWYGMKTYFEIKCFSE